MGYYDFDHFWESDRVCGQKTQAEIPRSKWVIVKQFCQQIFPELFDRQVTAKKKKNL